MKVQNKNRMPRKSLRSQAGDFIVSLSIALIILAVISIVAFIAFRDDTRKNEMTVTVQNVIKTAGLLRANFGVNNNYGVVTTAVAVQARAIPESQRITGTTTAQNSYGGAVTVTPATLTQANDAVALSYMNIPSHSCAEIVIGSQHQARRIAVGGTVIKPTDAALNMAALTAACDTGAPVEVIWTVGRTGS